MPTGSSNSSEKILCVLPACFTEDVKSQTEIEGLLFEVQEDLELLLRGISEGRDMTVAVAGDSALACLSINHYTELWISELASTDHMLKQDSDIFSIGNIESAVAYVFHEAGKPVKTYDMAGILADGESISLVDLGSSSTSESASDVEEFKILNSLVHAQEFVNEFEQISNAPDICICLGSMATERISEVQYYLAKDILSVVEKYSDSKYIGCLIISGEFYADLPDGVQDELESRYPDLMDALAPLIEKSVNFIANIENPYNYPLVVFLT